MYDTEYSLMFPEGVSFDYSMKDSYYDQKDPEETDDEDLFYDEDEYDRDDEDDDWD